MHAGEGQTTPLRKDSTACTLSQERRLYTTHTGSATRYDLLKELHNIHNFSQIADHLGGKGVKHKAPSVPLTNLSKKVRLSPPYKKRLHTRANTTKMENTRSQSNIAVKKSTLAQDKNTSTPNTHSRRNQLYTTQKVKSSRKFLDCQLQMRVFLQSFFPYSLKHSQKKTATTLSEGYKKC